MPYSNDRNLLHELINIVQGEISSIEQCKLYFMLIRRRFLEGARGIALIQVCT